MKRVEESLGHDDGGSREGGGGSSELFRSTGSSNRESLSTNKNKTHQPATMQSSRASQIYEELNTLKFSTVLYGRDAELRLLETLYEQLGTNRKTPEKENQDGEENKQYESSSNADNLNMVLVAGESGTGKTAVVKEFSARISKKDPNVVFASGKYDQYLSVPYGAFVSAFSQICNDIRFHPLYESKIQDAILKAVGEDYKLLLDLIPNIGELVFESGERSPTTFREEKVAAAAAEEYDIVKSKEKFKFLLQRFMRAICQPDHKAVLFLDDIQWIDNASLRLLEMILDDASLESSLLIVGTCRDDEVNEAHDLTKLLTRIQRQRKKTSINIPIQKLPYETVESFISDLLNLDRCDVQELANIAYTRVDGNIFFLIQFITALRDGGLLRYNIGSMKWGWDGGEIRRSTVVAGNVLEVLMNKMEQLPQDAKMVLQVVACLGASFDEDLVTLVIINLKTAGVLSNSGREESLASSKESQERNDKRTPIQALSSLVEEGLLENSDNYGGLSRRAFCFAHSQIALAAHELIDGEAMPRLKLQMGQILYENRSKLDYQSLLFTIVDLWNDGSDLVTGSKQTRILIELNFEAGKKALESLAFGASCYYLQQALDLIPEHKRWEEEDYDMSLAIYNCLIKAEYSNGTWEPLRRHATEIIKLPDSPVMDKIVAFGTMISVLSIQERNHKDAIALAVHVLKLLGVPFSLKLGKFAVVGGLVKTKRLLSKVPLETLLSQSDMTDNVKHVAIDILAMVNSSMYAANPDLMAVSVLKTLRWSLKYGVSKDTAKCVSFYGLVEMALGNAEYGTKACELAVELAKKRNLMDTEYSPTAAVYGKSLNSTTVLLLGSTIVKVGH